MWLFWIFVAVPIIEIALFIQVGGWLGLWPTLGIVVLTAALGTFLVRSQGIAALGRLQQSMQNLTDPTEPLAHGAMILASGLLLLTPGFFTDALGFAMLVPGVRSAVIRSVRARVKTASFSYGTATGQPPRAEDDIIDAEPVRHDPSQPSGWTRPD